MSDEIEELDKMKHLAIRKHYSYFFTNEEQIESGDFDGKLEMLDEEMKALFEKYDLKLAESLTSFIGMEKYSICHCESCNNLMVNRSENPAGFSETHSENDIKDIVYNGGNHEGKVLCEECLPTTHRWGLHS